MKKSYMIQINLSGLSRKVFSTSKLYPEPICGEWYDRTGNLSWSKSKREDGIYRLVFFDKKKAKAALEGAKMVADFMIERLK